jgi:hypothetical protein
MTVSGIFPYPDSGTAEKLFHMGVIPYEIIPHEELYCIHNRQKMGRRKAVDIRSGNESR